MKPLLRLGCRWVTVLLLAGCAPDHQLEETCMGSCTVVTGRLVTANGQQAIKGAQVVVKWVYGSATWIRALVKDQTTTDANGNYRVSFLIQDKELTEGYFEVAYVVDENKYYTIGDNEVALYKAKRDTTIELPDYVIPRKAYIRLTITNPTEVPRYAYSTDFNTCYAQNNVFSPRIQGGGAVVFWNDLPANYTLPIAGDQPVLARSYKVKNGVTTRSTDSLFIAAGATHSYTVTY